MKGKPLLNQFPLLASLLAAACATIPARAADCPVTVSGDRPGLEGTIHAMAVDANLTTFFKSSYNDWQYLQLDFGCSGTLYGFRRYMTRDGTNTLGNRATQGEGAQYSADGTIWIECNATNTTGWQTYTNYGIRQQAWRSLPYGWSEWLNLLHPAPARFLRFSWDGNADALNEVQFHFVPDRPIGPEDFGPTAERIGFDNQAPGAAVARQLTMQGLRLQTLEGPPLLVSDTFLLQGLPPRSGPYAAGTTNQSAGLEIRFRSPRQKFGLYVAIPSATGTIRAVLEGFDTSDTPLGQTVLELDPAAAARLDNFIGLGLEQDNLWRVTLTLEGVTGTIVVDDLLVEPSQSQQAAVLEAVTPWRLVLESTTAGLEEKSRAIDGLLLLPSTAASQALQKAARSDADPEVRARAILGLTQLRDPDAIGTLVSLGMNPPESSVGQAAHHAVWALRRDFPLPDPPEVTLAVIDPILPGIPFTVEARVTSPVDQPHVQVRFKGCKGAQPITRGGAPDVFEGPLSAGQEITLRARYVAPETNLLAVPVEVRVSQNLVDAATYPAWLYVDVQAGGGTASMIPFPGWSEPGARHILADPEAQETPQGVSKKSASASSSGKRNLVVRGTLLFQDGNPGSNLAITPEGNPKAGRFIKVQIVEVDDPDNDYGEGWTSPSGWFSIRAEDVPNNGVFTLLLEVDNHASIVFLETDVGDEEFLQLLGTYSTGTSGDVDVGVPVVPIDYRSVEVDTNGDLWWGGGETHMVAFAAAMNINEVILVAREDVTAHRDPRERDTISRVRVEYGDSSWNHYFRDIVLTTAFIDGAIHSNNLSAIDYGFVDETIAHEYGHHLQLEIGSWDMHAGEHFLCQEVDSWWWNNPEFAWSEGFAGYFGNHIVFNKPGMSRASTQELDTGCGTAGDGVTFISRPRNPEAWYSVEGHVASFLWDLADGWGQWTDAWDQVDGTANHINGHHHIMQIFDHELDDGSPYSAMDDAPDLPEFYTAWLSRFPGLNYAAGQPVVDALLNRLGIVPGDDSPGGAAERPFPIVEGNPDLPEERVAWLELPTGRQPQFEAPLPAPYTPGQPVLTVRRRYSYLEARPGGLLTPGDQFQVRLGFSNLGDVTMPVDSGGSPDTSVFANWSAHIQFSSNASNWLSISPTNGTFRSTNAFELVDLVFDFLPAMQQLPGSNQYTADIHLEYQTLTRTESRLIRVVLDQITGAQDDPDEDGLTNEREHALALINPSRYGCLSGRNRDSDGDGLPDGAEVDVYGTSPCLGDTDDDGMSDALEVRYDCLDPLVPDAHLDSDADGIPNEVEVLHAFHSDPCDADQDDDNVIDGLDNCRFTSNPDQADLDGDGRGDACDRDIDGDGCLNRYDPNPTDLIHPDNVCLARPTDPTLTRAGRLMTRFDPRLDDPRLHLLLDCFRPQGPDSCGPEACPPPSVKLLKSNGDLYREIFADQWDFDQSSGFASTAELLPDLDEDDFPDLAIAAPNDNEGAGAVVVVSGRTGQLLARIQGTRPGEGLGTAMALRNLTELAIGAPGNDEVSGAVFLLDLSTFTISDPLEKGTPGDRFGAALLPLFAGESEPLLIGVPGYEERGAVYQLDDQDALNRIASGESLGDEFGAALARAGDLTGDGISEVLVGAPGASRPPGLDRFASQRQAPAVEPLFQVGQVILLSLDGQPIWTRTGWEERERFGSALASITPGSGPVFEFLVGAPGWQDQTGRAYLLTAEGELPLFIAGESAGAEMGRFVGAGPDYDGDGIPSMITVEPGVSGPLQIPGRSTVYELFSVPWFRSILRLENGPVQLLLGGSLGVRCRIETSVNLTLWETLTTVVIDHPAGRIVVDDTASNVAQRFYRVSVVPSP